MIDVYTTKKEAKSLYASFNGDDNDDEDEDNQVSLFICGLNREYRPFIQES